MIVTRTADCPCGHFFRVRVHTPIIKAMHYPSYDEALAECNRLELEAAHSAEMEVAAMVVEHEVVCHAGRDG